MIGFSLYLMDGKECNINKMDNKKRISLARVDRVFKLIEVVPLFGDIMIAPFEYIKKTPHYDSSKWQLCNSGQLSAQVPDLERTVKLSTGKWPTYAPNV